MFINKLDLNVKKTYVFSSNKGVKEAVINGLGIALVSRLIIEKELIAGELCQVHVEQDKLRLTREKAHRSMCYPS